MGELVNFIEHSNCSMSWTPKQMLEAAIKDIDECIHEERKALLIFLDDKDGGYGVSYTNSGMRSSEIISLCDIVKILSAREMNYV